MLKEKEMIEIMCKRYGVDTKTIKETLTKIDLSNSNRENEKTFQEALDDFDKMIALLAKWSRKL